MWYDTQHAMCTDRMVEMRESSLAHCLLFNFTWAAAALQISDPATVYACMGTCPFPPAVPPPLPAISRANLKLCYYDCCTRCVGGQFRTSTPSINPAMGPTSWLNRPVPLPDNLSSDEAKLRSCNYTWTSLLCVSPLAKNLSWWLFDSPTRLLPWSLGSSAQTSLLTKAVFFLSLHMRIIINTYRHPRDKAHFGFISTCFSSVEVSFIHCSGHYFSWKNQQRIGHYKCFPFLLSVVLWGGLLSSTIYGQQINKQINMQ